MWRRNRVTATPRAVDGLTPELPWGAFTYIERGGSPFRVFRLDAVELRARLAGEEITSPTDLRSLAAISLAALKTSSSMMRVVRIGVLLGNCLIEHHAPDAPGA